MADFCYFCKKKIGLFEGSFKVDDKIFPESICSSCSGKKNVLRGIQVGDFNTVKTFFTEQQQRNDIDPAVKGLIDKWIEIGAPRQKVVDSREEVMQREREAQQRSYEEMMEERRAWNEKKAEFEQVWKSFMTSTGYNFEGHKIVEYKGIISGATVLGSGLLTDVSTSISDFMGGEIHTLEYKIVQARESAKKKLLWEAFRMDANAVIGIDYDISVLAGNAIVILATGTAVVAKKEFTDTLTDIESALPEL